MIRNVQDDANLRYRVYQHVFESGRMRFVEYTYSLGDSYEYIVFITTNRFGSFNPDEHSESFRESSVHWDELVTSLTLFDHFSHGIFRDSKFQKG